MQRTDELLAIGDASGQAVFWPLSRTVRAVRRRPCVQSHSSTRVDTTIDFLLRCRVLARLSGLSVTIQRSGTYDHQQLTRHCHTDHLKRPS